MKSVKGFTLVELAIALVVIGFLISMGFSGLGELYENRSLNESKNRLEMAQSVLLSFVKVQKYLPCPDTDGDGKENRASDGKECSATGGTLPWKDLGVTRANVQDGYGHLFSYMVNGGVTDSGKTCDDNKSASYFCAEDPPKYTLQTPPTASASDDANLKILDHTDHNKVLAEQVSVVIIAHNKRGCNGGGSQDEQANCNVPGGSGATYYGGGYDKGVFDDQVISLHGNQIKAVTPGLIE